MLDYIEAVTIYGEELAEFMLEEEYNQFYRSYTPTSLDDWDKIIDNLPKHDEEPPE